MRSFAAALLLACAPLSAFAADAAPSAAPAAAPSAAPAPSAAKKDAKPAGGAFKSEDEKTLYALGFFLGSRLTPSLAPLSLTPAETAIVDKGLRDQLMSKKAQVDMDTYGPKINELASGRLAKMGAARKAKEKKFLDAEAAKPGAQKQPDGLLYFEEKAGTGETPAAADTVKVNYEGKLADGKVFDSSYKRGEPAEFPLNGVIQCWTEGVAKMKVGGKARLVCPSDIGYGDRGSPPTIPGGASLVFEVELLGVTKAPAADKTEKAEKPEKKTADLKAQDEAFAKKAAGEKGAEKLPSGLIYKDLKKGTGAQPTAEDRVKVHYAGKLTDGTEFDSSYKRNEPATFPLRGVIKCWTEGVAKMKVGGKAQLVCPASIAYGDQGRPPLIPGGATLVFEVELLDIVK